HKRVFWFEYSHGYPFPVPVAASLRSAFDPGSCFALSSIRESKSLHSMSEAAFAESVLLSGASKKRIARLSFLVFRAEAMAGQTNRSEIPPTAASNGNRLIAAQINRNPPAAPNKIAMQ